MFEQEHAYVDDALRHRVRNFEAKTSADGRKSQPVSGGVEYRPHADGRCKRRFATTFARTAR